MKIYRADKEDLEEVNELLTEFIQDERKYDSNINQKYVVKNYYDQFINNSECCIIVAKSYDKIVGYGFGFIENSGEIYENKVAKLDAVFVKTEYRKQGIANEIIKYFTNWAKEKEAKYINLTVCKANEDARKLYEKQGFETEKLILKKRLV